MCACRGGVDWLTTGAVGAAHKGVEKEISQNGHFVRVWRLQRAEGAPATYERWQPKPARWYQRKWDVDHMQYVQEGLGPAHVNAREVLEGKGK